MRGLPPLPWRSFLLSLFLLVALGTLFTLSNSLLATHLISKPYQPLTATFFALLWFLLGLVLVRKGRQVFIRFGQTRPISERGIWNLLLNLAAGLAYLFVGIVSLHMVNIHVTSLLVGGAVTGVVVGIAAQSTLSNLISGLILLTLHPYSIGQYITVRSWMFGGAEYRGEVTDINLFYTILLEGETKRVIPNSAAVISTISIEQAPNRKSFTLDIPYSISQMDLKERWQTLTQNRGSLEITDFTTDTYKVRIVIPRDLDVDLIRQLMGSVK